MKVLLLSVFLASVALSGCSRKTSSPEQTPPPRLKEPPIDGSLEQRSAGTSQSDQLPTTSTDNSETNNDFMGPPAPEKAQAGTAPASASAPVPAGTKPTEVPDSLFNQNEPARPPNAPKPVAQGSKANAPKTQNQAPATGGSQPPSNQSSSPAKPKASQSNSQKSQVTAQKTSPSKAASPNKKVTQRVPAKKSHKLKEAIKNKALNLRESKDERVAAIIAMDPEDAFYLETLIEIFTNAADNEDVRITAGYSLSLMKSPKVVEAFVKVFTQDNKDVIIRAAAEGLATLKDPRTDELLLAALEHPRYKEATPAIISALGQMNVKAAIGPMIDVLKNDVAHRSPYGRHLQDPFWHSARAQAAYWLGEMRAQEAREALNYVATNSREEDADLAEIAKVSLKRLNQKKRK